MRRGQKAQRGLMPKRCLLALKGAYSIVQQAQEQAPFDANRHLLGIRPLRIRQQPDPPCINILYCSSIQTGYIHFSLNTIQACVRNILISQQEVKTPTEPLTLPRFTHFIWCKIRLVKSKHKTIPKKVRLYASKNLLQLYQKPNDEFEPQLVGMEHELLQTDQIILMTSAAFMLL